MRRVMAVLILVAGLAVVPTTSVAAGPPTLTKTQAIAHVRAAIKAEFIFVQSGSRPLCARVSRLRFSCKRRWTNGVRSYRATVTIIRTGIPTSPIDSYRIVANSGGRFLTPRRETKTGRIIVKTREARLGQTLRLLGFDFDEHQEIEVTPGAFTDPYVPTNEFSVPAPGTRFVTVTATVRNVGQGRYTGTLYSANLITTANVTIEGSFAAGCEGTLDVPAGEERIACAAFEVPVGVIIRHLEYSAGRETGAWAP